jgi:Replication factor C.
MMIAEQANGDMRYAINLLERIISKHKTITKESVMLELDLSLVRNAIKQALNGNFVEARKMIEDAYLLSGRDHTTIVNEIYRFLDTLEDEEIKIKLYEKLAEFEYRCTVGSSPLIQLVGFLAYCWVIKHVPKR